MNQYGGNKKSPQEFDILNLIQEVKKHPILYAKDIKASKESREEAWHTISSELDTPLQIVKTKWRSLRDSLSRLKRDRSRRGKKTWYMLKHLTFLPSVTELLDNPQDVKNENYYDDVIECHDLSHDAIRYIDGDFAQENTEMVDLKYVKINEETSDEEVDNENEMPVPPPVKKIKLLKPLTQNQKTAPVYKAIVPKPAETTYIKFSHFGGDETNEEFMSPLTVDQNCIQIVSPISPEIIEQNANRTEPVVKAGDEAAQQRLTEHLSNICSHFSTEEFGYSVHIANQLRNLPRLEREILRNKIDNLIYETHMSVITSESN